MPEQFPASQSKAEPVNLPEQKNFDEELDLDEELSLDDLDQVAGGACTTVTRSG